MLIRENSLKQRYDALSKNSSAPVSRERSGYVIETFLVLPQIRRVPIITEMTRANLMIVDSQPAKMAEKSCLNCSWGYHSEKVHNVTQAYEITSENRANCSYDSPKYTMQDQSTIPSAPVSPYNPDYANKSNYMV